MENGKVEMKLDDFMDLLSEKESSDKASDELDEILTILYELEVELWSDSGVDQCDYDDAEVIIEDAYRHTHNLKDGEQFEDGTNKVDYFVIYANYRNEMEEEE